VPQAKEFGTVADKPIPSASGVPVGIGSASKETGPHRRTDASWTHTAPVATLPVCWDYLVV